MGMARTKSAASKSRRIKAKPARRAVSARAPISKRRTSKQAAKPKISAARSRKRKPRTAAKSAAPKRIPAKARKSAGAVKYRATPARSLAHSGGNGSNPAKKAEPPRAFHLPKHLVVSPDITKHPWENRRDYLILVAAIAASDSELHPDELKLLTGWMERFELPPDARAEVLRVANRGDVDLVEIARRLADTALTWSVMLDMMGMAMADGVLMDDEILLLRGLASVLRIDPVDFNILIEFVHSAHQAAQLSNPEPLYEHAIESAFQLLSRRHVRLFTHTRLCVNYPEYDQLLKQRWTKFEAGTHA